MSERRIEEYMSPKQHDMVAHLLRVGDNFLGPGGFSQPEPHNWEDRNDTTAGDWTDNSYPSVFAELYKNKWRPAE